jgi:hypothetical protein
MTRTGIDCGLGKMLQQGPNAITSLLFTILRITIGSSDRGSRLRWAMEGVDDLDKSASFGADAAPRRSTSSLDTL